MQIGKLRDNNITNNIGELHYHVFLLTYYIYALLPIMFLTDSLADI